MVQRSNQLQPRVEQTLGERIGDRALGGRDVLAEVLEVLAIVEEIELCLGLARPEPTWHENVVGIDTGVHIDERGYGRLTIARIDGKEIETWSFDR